MSSPLAEDALDFLDSQPEAKQMVKEMLAAVVDYPAIHVNSFTLQNVGGGKFDYFLGMRQGGGASPFLNHRRLTGNIVPQLIHYRIAGPTREPNQGSGWNGFTDEAMEWHRVYGGATPDEIRKKLGRWLQKQIGGQLREFKVDVIAEELTLSPERVRTEIHMLLAAGLVERYLSGDMEFGILRLAEPRGVLWAAADFPPISLLLNTQQAPLPAPRPRRSPWAQRADSEIRDVFISHASEDKNDVARPLADALIGNGLRIWFDEYELKIGDSLRRKIDEGLATSRYGVVILSDSFFAKSWPQHELDGLVVKSNSGGEAILPIWHKISKDEVIAYSPTLADKVARNTSEWTIQEIADEIAQVVTNAEDGDS